MSLNIGHTLQKLIHNSPVAISANSTSSSVVTSGGNVYQAGLISARVEPAFHEIHANQNIVGHVVDVQSTEGASYLLNDAGVVFVYDYNAGSCSPVIREVYSPSVCGGDKAVRIRTGSAHVVILTEKHRVWGAGSNCQYQLVPQGQCSYDVATELLVTDTNVHDDNNCCAFMGNFNEPCAPHIPKSCAATSAIKKTLKGAKIGYVAIPNVTLSLPAGSACFSGSRDGVLRVPIVADLKYVGFIATGSNCEADGTVTYTMSNVKIAAGCGHATFIVDEETSCRVKITVPDELVLAEGPVTYAAQISTEGKCKNQTVRLALNGEALNTVIAVGNNNGGILLSAGGVTNVYGVTPASVTIEGPSVECPMDLFYDLEFDCCAPCGVEEKLPQPCWQKVFAGFNSTVMVDSCNRIYVLGSLHNVRNNAALLKRTCLEEILNKADATISLPASQLNCGVPSNNTNCVCVPGACRKPFKTDLERFGISLKFPQQDETECCVKGNNVCDILRAIQQCNDNPACANTCSPCEPDVFLNVFEEGDDVPAISSITVRNKRSVSKAISQCDDDKVCVAIRPDSVVEFDLNHFCIDACDYPLSKTLVLETGIEDGEHITVYVDIDTPGTIQFTSQSKACNVDFVVRESVMSAHEDCHCKGDNDKKEFILTFGGVMDPVELANLRALMIKQCGFPSPQFRNPIKSKLISTYLKGGDSVHFKKNSVANASKLAITADVPTVLRVNRRVLDIGVGDNNLSVLVGGLSCPNDILVIGQNCFGELGIESHASTVCWKKVNRCLMDCQVNAIFTGPHVTTYVTQSGRVFGAGLWKNLVNSTVPVCIPSISMGWKTKQMAISKNQMLILSQDSCLFGVGDNRLGELGLCHIDCVPVPVPVGFLAELNHLTARQMLVRDRLPAKCCKPFYKDCEEKACCEECKHGKPCRSLKRHHSNVRVTPYRKW